MHKDEREHMVPVGRKPYLGSADEPRGIVGEGGGRTGHLVAMCPLLMGSVPASERGREDYVS